MIMLVAGACSIQQRPQTSAEERDGKLLVYASIYPMYDFAQKIGGDKIDLRMMVPPGAEPHDWEPTAKLMAQMEKADVFIYNGVNMEMWADKLVKSISSEKLKVVEASSGVSLIKLEDHEEGEYGKHEGEEDNHGDYDPHVWLDPMRALKQAENIKNAFVAADEENMEFYESNFNEFANKLRELDQKYREELKDRKLNEIVVAHAAFGYLADRYGLEQISVSGLTPQEEPSAAKMAQITELVREHGIKYIFFETLTSPKLAKVIANETGAKTAVLNPVGGLTKDEIEEGKGYISIMEDNLEILKKALY
ncbi:MAG: zinc transport system substrate-binding protein [Candidatus Petromonas sp.]|nr:zinc transport system substrate-binding protein [Candidatus Petromonas sp.]